MRVTKYPQSCMVIEHDSGGRLLVDPGFVAMDAMSFDDFGTIDAVLFTHRHADHCDERALDAIGDRRIPVHANHDVCERTSIPTSTVTGGQSFTAAGFAITAHDLPHVEMVDGSAGPPNTGFVLDERMLIPGDAIRAGKLRVDVLAVPIVGPSIAFRDAYMMVEATGASTAIPIHYDVFLANPEQFAGFCDITTVVVLGAGESTTV